MILKSKESMLMESMNSLLEKLQTTKTKKV